MDAMERIALPSPAYETDVLTITPHRIILFGWDLDDGRAEAITNFVTICLLSRSLY